jgi:hypothetical protein
MHFTTSTIAAVATIFGFSQGALAVPFVERTSCSIQLPVAGPFKLELIPSDNPNAADPVGLTRVGPNLQKLSILPTTNQLFNYNSKDHHLFSFSDKPGLGNAAPNSDKFLTFSRDSKADGQLTQVFGEDCEIFLVRTTASDRDIWYVDEDEGIRYAPKGNPKRTSALRIDPVSLPGN